MEQNNLRWEDVPQWWVSCFNKECAEAGRCLRFKTGGLAPAGICQCVTPKALEDGGCRYFAPIQKVSYARGFTHIYDQVLKSDYTLLRKAMTKNLQGKTYYYQYMRGERRLSPEQQQLIRNLFAERGYADNVEFDAYEEDYVFKRLEHS